jgi:phospholipase C
MPPAVIALCHFRRGGGSVSVLLAGVTDESRVANLRKVEHVVVLMLENRSFDHMLGYLSLEGGRSDVDGLKAEFADQHGGLAYRVHHLDRTAIVDDPEHSSDAVDLQLGGGKMDGFVASSLGPSSASARRTRIRVE